MFSPMRASVIVAILSASAALSPATTLQRLSLEDLARESTAVVRGRVVAERAERAGALVYTVARIEVTAAWKGGDAESLEVSSPGGVWQGSEQRFPGAPRLVPGRDYVLFLWQGPSGRVQPTGFSQGVFEVFEDADGRSRVRREAVSEELLLPDAGGPQAASERLDLPLSELDAVVGKALRSEESGR
jgi:hypothetical protein